MCFGERSAHDPPCYGGGSAGLGRGGSIGCGGLARPLSPVANKQGQLTQGRAQSSLAVLMRYASLFDVTGAGMMNRSIPIAGRPAGQQRELATRQVAPRLLRPSAIRLGVPPNLLLNPWPVQDGMPPGEEHGGPDAPAVAPVRVTAVRPLTAAPDVDGRAIVERLLAGVLARGIDGAVFEFVERR
jgi:hypothetical protein